ncbi:hypothetical protein JX265_000739 [Neoarthrinium moseri]|uniref:Integral membrane protein n=1 Tax=Neoarthrinium moseri TaxID=1658444 RepID=A0A9P9WWE2_9PEZI|nr:uncharacterized protein JN550_007153 [Neoarthrinium moseri]KAI1867422.1 hypothetical protein JN550_007153 [Neoarthrinium moseri]KAI1880499.1 hypothetical protein JX265_000739 [Neoarthrinium moseri]
MPYRGSEYRPPLPPRSPRPPAGTSSPASGRGYSPFPLQPPASPFQNPGSQVPAEAGPPVPPRPSEYSGGPFRPPPTGHYGPSPASPPGLAPPDATAPGYMSFPPPPVSPNRMHSRPPHIRHPAPPLPPRPQSTTSTQSCDAYRLHSVTPPVPVLTPSAQNPGRLTSFPPPPPGPPPTQSPEVFRPTPHQPTAHSRPSPVNTSHGESSSVHRSKFPLPPSPPVDPEIPSSPPPAYTPVADPTHLPTAPSSVSLTSCSTMPSPVTSPVTSSPSISHLTGSSSPPPTSSSTAFHRGAYPFSISSMAPQLVASPVATHLVSSPPVASPTSPPTSASVSSPQSPHELSFFPAPPLISPAPRQDPIEELMQSMGLGGASSSDSEAASLRNEATHSTSYDASVATSDGFQHSSVAPLRPPKTPLSTPGLSRSSLIHGSAAMTSFDNTIPDRDGDEADEELYPAPKPCSTKLPTSLRSHDPSAILSANNSTPMDASHMHPETYVRQGVGPGFRRAQGPPEGVGAHHTGKMETYKPNGGITPPKSSMTPTSCIDTPVTFETSWYSHSAAPDFFICSRCYVDHIATTQFRNIFRCSTFSDNKPRHCRFSASRMKDNIFKTALATNYLQPVIDWMRLRSTIIDCKGIDGASGDAGVRWFNAKHDAIPGFVVCQACYEDYALCNSLSSFLQPHPQAQGSQDVWACDLAVPFIQKQYQLDGKTKDWNNFAFEAKSRLSIPRCPQNVQIKSKGKKWFTPINGPAGLVLCAACYCDQIIHTGEEAKWQVAHGLVEASDLQVRCAVGRSLNVRIPLARARDMDDFSLFWNAVRGLESHALCDEQGITDGQWYTLNSSPRGFQICGACHAAIAESLNISQFFERKCDVAPGTNLRCCFNLTHPRLRDFLPRLLEMYFTGSPTALTEFAKVYALIAPCKKYDEIQDGHWYGWPECTICAECYVGFAQHQALASQMPLNSTMMVGNRTCELYSERLRGLYTSCSEKSPPDATELLNFAQHRRQVYAQTVPQMRMLVFQQRQAASQQNMLNTLSMFHNNAGTLQQINSRGPLAYTYNVPGHWGGYGYANLDLAQGAAAGQQAMGVLMGAQGLVSQCAMLEQQWKAVE